MALVLKTIEVDEVSKRWVTTGIVCTFVDDFPTLDHCYLGGIMISDIPQF